MAVELDRARRRAVGWATFAALAGVALASVASGVANGDELDVGSALGPITASGASSAAAVAAALGATLVAVELATGGLARTTAVEPRRTRVVVAKVLAAALVAGGVIGAAHLVLIVALVLAAALGTFQLDVETVWLGEVIGRLATVIVGAGAAGAIGASLAFVVRSTGAVIVVVLVLLVLAEPGAAELVDALDQRGPLTGAGSLMAQGERYAGPTIPIALSGLAVTGWLVAVVGGAVEWVRRRDIAG